MGKVDLLRRELVYIPGICYRLERHWTPLDLEAASFVWAIKRLRGYLWGTEFAFSRTTRLWKTSEKLETTTRESRGGSSISLRLTRYKRTGKEAQKVMLNSLAVATAGD